MKDLRATRGTDLVRAMVAEGEHERQDFKFAISDAHKIARSISAFANNAGGRLLIGVKDNGVIAGVRNEEDTYVVELAASRYCRPSQQVNFRAYKVDGTATVIVAEIDKATQRPVLAGEPDGTWRAYYRVADENIAAHPLMLRAWRMASAAAGFDSDIARVLAYLETCGRPMAVREIAIGLHASEAATENAVATLAAAGLADFCYSAGTFAIRAIQEDVS